MPPVQSLGVVSLKPVASVQALGLSGTHTSPSQQQLKVSAHAHAIWYSYCTCMGYYGRKLHSHQLLLTLITNFY